jgi:hypothetical protein
MTEETLKQANNTMHAIKDIGHQIDVIQRMMDLDEISLYTASIGSIILKGDIKADVLAAVYNDRKEWLGELQDDFRRL